MVLAGAIAVALGLALAPLGRGLWLDEFWTLALVRPGSTPLDILQRLQHDAHPYLYFGLVWLAQELGLHHIAALRGLNLLSAALIAAPLYAAVRGGDLDWRTALLLLAVAMSSHMFLQSVAELRPYALTYGAAIGLSVVWFVYLRRALAGVAVGAHLLALWALTLGALANLQYFGCLMGGLLTGAMLLVLIIQGRWRTAVALAGVSLLVAAPALAMAAIQAQSSIGADMNWITTTWKEAVWIAIGVARHAGVGNPALIFGAVLALYLLGRSPGAWRAAAPALGLLLVAGLFLALIMAANAMKPLIIDRYLIAVAGVTTAGLVLLAAGEMNWRQAPILTRWMMVLACVFALAGAVRSHLQGAFEREGWRTSALALKAAVERCPGTTIYTTPDYVGRPVSPEYARLYFQTKSYGHAYYLREFGLTATDLTPGQTVGPRGGCPAIVWLEHTSYKDAARAFARDLKVPAGGRAELVFSGTGALVYVR